MGTIKSGASIGDEVTIKDKLEEFKGQSLILYELLPGIGRCVQLGTLLQKIYQIKENLSQIEQGLLLHHLGCCIAPRIKVPAEVVLAMSHLAAKRHGALIVIEQQNDIQDYLQGGVSINAYVNAAILENIFYPGSPLHDGALVIKDTTIVRANCVLPLATQASELEVLRLGTRHRAALGLSQLCDALVLVVSEEKGWISLFLGGQFFPNLGAFDLLEKLAS